MEWWVYSNWQAEVFVVYLIFTTSSFRDLFASVEEVDLWDRFFKYGLRSWFKVCCFSMWILWIFQKKSFVCPSCQIQALAFKKNSTCYVFFLVLVFYSASSFPKLFSGTVFKKLRFFTWNKFFLLSWKKNRFFFFHWRFFRRMTRSFLELLTSSTYASAMSENVMADWQVSVKKIENIRLLETLREEPIVQVSTGSEKQQHLNRIENRNGKTLL